MLRCDRDVGFQIFIRDKKCDVGTIYVASDITQVKLEVLRRLVVHLAHSRQVQSSLRKGNGAFINLVFVPLKNCCENNCRVCNNHDEQENSEKTSAYRGLMPFFIEVQTLIVLAD